MLIQGQEKKPLGEPRFEEGGKRNTDTSLLEFSNIMEGVNTIHPAPEIHEPFVIHRGYGTLCTSSCTILTILRPL